MSMKDLDVEIEDGSLIVQCSGFKDLNLNLPEGFDEDELRCQFDKASRELMIRVPAPEPPKTVAAEKADLAFAAPKIESSPNTTLPSGQSETNAPQFRASEEFSTGSAATTGTQAHPSDKMEPKQAPQSAPVKKVEAKTPKVAPPGTDQAQLDQVAAMGRSMVERLKESGAIDDAKAMEDVLKQMEAAAQGQLGADGMSALDSQLDGILKSVCPPIDHPSISYIISLL